MSLDPPPAPFGTHAPTGFAAWAIERARKFGQGYAARRTAFALRRLGLRALGGKPVDTVSLGAKFRLVPYANVCEKRVLFTPQYFDAAEREWLAAHVTPGFRFIDIGANVGAYALFVAALAGADAKILALEPQPVIFARLSTNIALNGFGTVAARRLAVADGPGELTLFLSARNQGEASLRGDGSATSTLVVPTAGLAELMRDEGFDRLDALKIDVEGAEDIILGAFFERAPEALWPRLLIIEDSAARWRIDIPDLLEQRGYRRALRTRLNLMYERG